MAFRYRHGDRPLDGYTILRGLGQGGFGEVYYARSDGGREVALKIIQQNHEIELRGVRQCMNLKSPYLVTIFDVHQDADGYPYVVMECIHGPSLRDVVHAAPSGHDLPKAVYLLREIGKGLAYLHDNGIVHRDLKPENIFYEDGFVKIGDYGLSKYISVSHQSGQTISVGSVHYMAPEIGSGNYQRGIDIYALGVIFYELLTGTVPFNGDSMGEILMKHLSCEPDVARIPAALQPIVKKSLAKLPEERYASVEDFLGAVLALEGTSAALDGFDPGSFASTTAVSIPSLVSAAPDLAAATEETRRPQDLATAAKTPPGSPPPPDPAPPVPKAPAPDVGTQANKTEKPRAPGHSRSSRDPYASELFQRKDLDQRLFISFVTTVAMGTAVWLLGGTRSSLPIGGAALIAAGVIPILIVEGFLVPRFRLDGGFARSAATFVLGALPVAGASAALGSRHPPLAVLAALFLVDWTGRVDPRRDERVSLSQALLAGLFGMVAGWATKTNPIASGGVLAGMSLVLNSFAPFAPRRPNLSPAPLSTTPQTPPAPKPQAAGPVPRGPAAPAFSENVSALGEQAAALGAAAADLAEPRVAPVALATLPAANPVHEITPPSRLVRTRDAAIAGVCGGLAARYAIDVAWVRLAFFLFTFITAGWALLAYIAMWVCMPKAESLRKQLASPKATANPGVSGPARVLWSIVACVALAIGVPLVVTAVAWFLDYHRRGHDEYAGAFAVGGFLILFASFAFVKGRSRHRLPFWRGTVQPIFVMALLAIAGGFTVLATLGRLPDDPFNVAIAVASVSGVLATLNGFSWFRWHRRTLLSSLKHPGPGELRAYKAHPGWLGLSTVFLALSFATLGFGTLLDVGVHGPVETPFGVFVAGEYQPHGPGPEAPIKFALLFFLPGLFSLVMARRPGGGAHVLRGAVGAVLTGLLALLLVTLLRDSYNDTTQHHVALINGGRIDNMEFLVLLLLTGAASAVLLAWPARPVVYHAEPLLTPGRTVA